MPKRSLDTGHNYSKGLVYLDFSFLANGASNPTAASFRGITLGDVVLTCTYAATGKYTITLSSKENYRYIVDKGVDLEDISSPDGAYASIGNVTNEGSATVGPSFVVSTFSAAGTLTQFTARRISVWLCFKDSMVGV
jgi:hypothetical protein